MNSINSNRRDAGSQIPQSGDTGPIPDAMLNDLRRLLWRMEKLPMYWAVVVGLLVGALWVAGEVLFFTAPARNPHIDNTSIAIGAGALTVLVALCYAPFTNRWFTGSIEARFLREVLYSKRLEDLSEYMGVCRISEHRKKIADDLFSYLVAAWHESWCWCTTNRAQTAIQITIAVQIRVVAASLPQPIKAVTGFGVFMSNVVRLPVVVRKTLKKPSPLAMFCIQGDHLW